MAKGQYDVRSAVVMTASLAVSFVVLGETFSWKHVTTASSDTPPASPEWQSFGDFNNWAVGETYSGDNPYSAVPGAGDAIYYGYYSDYNRKIANFNLADGSYTVRDILGGTSQWQPYLLLLTNGTLTVTGSFTNNSTHVHVYAGGKFVYGPDCDSIFGSSSIYTLFSAHEGGEVDIGGRIWMLNFHMLVNSGGTMTLRPEMLAIHSLANHTRDSWLRNQGTLNLPNGLTVDGVWTSSGDGAGCHFVLSHEGGVLNIGGNFAKSEYTNGKYNNNHAHFILAGGTINATNDVSFVRFDTVLMTNDAAAVVNVAEGKTLDLSNMTFAEGTSLAKTGPGMLKLGTSVPTALSVEGGVLALHGKVSFGDGLSLSSGATLHIAATGVEFGAIAGMSSANITFDPSLTGGIAALLTSSDPATLTAILGRLGDAPAGYEYRIDGGTLFLDKPHASTVFYWKNETTDVYDSFFNASYWGIGKTNSENTEGLVPGADDWIYYGNAYQRYLTFDMNGMRRIVKGIANGLDADENAWSPCHIAIRNGTLEFTTSFTNRNADVSVSNGGRFVLGENCSTLAGDGTLANSYIVNSGGSCDLGGSIYVYIMKTTVASGGDMTFRPGVFKFSNASPNYASYMRNSGNLAIPQGFTLGGSERHPCIFSIEQNAGTLLIGGNLTMADTADQAKFILAGGTVNVTNDVAFTGFHTVVMTNNASATVSVSSGKTFDLSTMAFEAGTALAKTGAGTLKVGASVPDAISVAAGILAVSGAAAFGEGLTLGVGTTLHFEAAGASAGAIPGLGDADVTIDPKSVGYGSVIIASTNAALLATVAEKLAPAIAAADNPKLRLDVTVSAGDPDVSELRLIRAPKGFAIYFR